MSQMDIINNNIVRGTRSIEKPQTIFRDENIAAAKSPASASDRNVAEVMKHVSRMFETLKRDEQYMDVDRDLDRLVIRIVNSNTKELVRQIPTEESLALTKRLQSALKKD